MTTEEIRSIAAYLGANYTAEIATRDSAGEIVSWGELTWSVNYKLIEGLTISPTNYRNVKVYLSQIRNLTDEAVWECARIAGHIDYSTNWINRSDESIIYAGLELFFDGRIANRQWEFDNNFNSERLPINNPGGIISYLQSVSIYVPGTINEEFVTLL